MREVPAPLHLTQTAPPVPDLQLLITHEPRLRVFLRNLRDLLWPRRLKPLHLDSAPASFWPDVFVDRRLPWLRFLQSASYHALALAMIWAGSRFLALQPQATPQPIFTHADVVYYAPSEYLPPLDTRRSDPAPAHAADPEYSAQPIISVPPEADNRSQTIVAPPNIQLHDVPLPNIVAWSGSPRMPIAPAPAVPASAVSRLTPQMDRSIVAPPPDMQPDPQANLQQAVLRETLQAPSAAVIAPPPAVEADATRRLGDINAARSSVVAPAPQLSLDAQRAFPGRTSAILNGRSSQVVAPPPSLGGSGRSRAGGEFVALSLDPAVGMPPAPPAGNRRGAFTATPAGHRGGSGTPGASTGNSTGAASAGNGKATGNGSGGKTKGDLPAGLYVGKTSNTTSPVAGDPAPNTASAYTVNPNLIASARPPRVARTMQPESQNKLSDEERAVFGDRKFYSLSLNMPNLNSAGGSWIIRFAARKSDSVLGSSSARPESSEASDGAATEQLSAPAATRKVDPAYPLELMRQNVGGTVILYAVIHADGTVGEVRVLRSVDDRLDHYASEAIAKWQFRPATKDGAPVDVEATFWIPFHPARVGSNF